MGKSQKEVQGYTDGVYRQRTNSGNITAVNGRVEPGDCTYRLIGVTDKKDAEKTQNTAEKMEPGVTQDAEEEKDDAKTKDAAAEAPKMVGVFEIFRYADLMDRILMLVGMLAACAHGSAMPMLMMVFGDMTDAFINNAGLKNYLSGLDLASVNLTVDEVVGRPEILPEVLRHFNRSNDTAMLQKMAQGNLLDQMQKYALYYVVMACIVLVLAYGQVTCWLQAAHRQSRRIKTIFFRSVLKKHIGWYDTHEVGELNTRMSDDINKIQEGIGQKLGSFFQWVCCFVAGFVIGFVRGWKLTLVILAVSPLLALSGVFVTVLGSALTTRELKAYAKAGAIAEEVLSAIRTVVAFGGEEKECKRYNENLYEARSFGVKKGLVTGGGMGGTYFIMFACFGLAFWYGARLVREGEYTGGQLLIVFFCVLFAAYAIGIASPNIQYFATARGAAYAVYNIIDEPSEIDSSSTAGLQPDDITGEVEFRDVVFNYPSRPDVPVLQGLSLSIQVGETVALVGASGCGKSTVVQLLQRFYDPLRGTVTLGGYNIRDLNIRYLRQKIGLVSQEPVLFATTIEENIRYGRDDVTREEIEQACREANAFDFISELPLGLKTLVGERGAQLSGGQKQRIAIARALVRNPKILLLDEATSALDTESESIVQAALDKVRMGRTTIVVAHRLSTVRTADQIAGIMNGVVVEKGSHEELMKIHGVYHTLVTNQQLHLEDDESPEEEDLEIEEYGSIVKVKRVASISSDRGIKRVRSVSESKEKDEEEEVKDLPDVRLTRIMRMNAPEWMFIVLGCLSALIAGGTMPAFAIVFSEIMGVFAREPSKQEEEANFYSLLFVVIGLVSGVALFAQGACFSTSGEYLTWRLRQLAFRAMLRQEVSYFDDHRHSTGALTTRLATDASAVQGATGARLGTICQTLCSVGVGVVIGFVFSWKLTLVILAFVPLLVIAGYLQTLMYTGYSTGGQEAVEEAGKAATEAMENIRTVASLTKEPEFDRIFNEKMDIPHKTMLRKSHIIGVSFAFAQAMLFFAYAAAFYFGAWLIRNDGLTFVDMFKVFNAVVFGATSVGEANAFAPDFNKAKVAAKRIFNLLDSVPAIDSYSPSGAKPEHCSGSIEFDDVRFCYPTRPDVTVLQGLNISVLPGQRVALVGSSGCGKSTSVQLIERFYDPTGGKITLDGVDLRDLNIKWMRAQVGIVSQEPILFDSSISDNIAYGDNSREVDMTEIIAAARAANIHQFIDSLPNGYDTNVGDKGAQLSGGQKQRVAIARALVRNPPVLLLDEATSALDTESEKVVQEALDKAQEGRTSIVIAHRLSTIQNADVIVVIGNGRVVEMGTHAELIGLKGVYFNLNNKLFAKQNNSDVTDRCDRQM